MENEANYEYEIQMQVNNWSALAQDQGIQRPGVLPNGRRTNSKLVYPILYVPTDDHQSKLVIGVVLTGYCGLSTVVGYSLQDLEPEVCEDVGNALEFEGFPSHSSSDKPMDWEAKTVVDVLLERRKALILLPADILFAREHGWESLFENVRQGTRSTNRTVVYKLGRAAIKFSEIQRKALTQLKHEANHPPFQVGIDPSYRSEFSKDEGDNAN